jgi:hypothetical protein
MCRVCRPSGHPARLNLDTRPFREPMIEETMAPAVLERVSSWIVRQTGTAAR